MTSNQAREKRRTAIEGLRTALHTISRGNDCLRSIEACEAMATAYQAVGRLQAIDEQEAYDEACSLGMPARSPRPSIIPDVNDLPSRPACAAPYCLQTAVDGSMWCFAHDPAALPDEDVPEIKHEQEIDAAYRMAVEAWMMTGDPNELDDESHEHLVQNGRAKPCGG